MQAIPWCTVTVLVRGGFTSHGLARRGLPRERQLRETSQVPTPSSPAPRLLLGRPRCTEAPVPGARQEQRPGWLAPPPSSHAHVACSLRGLLASLPAHKCSQRMSSTSDLLCRMRSTTRGPGLRQRVTEVWNHGPPLQATLCAPGLHVVSCTLLSRAGQARGTRNCSGLNQRGDGTTTGARGGPGGGRRRPVLMERGGGRAPSLGAHSEQG